MRRGAWLGLLLLARCSSAPGIETPPPDDGANPFDVVLRTATPAEREAFAKGNALFDVVYGEADGLGPLFIAPACSSCHARANDASGVVQKMVILDPDGRPSDDQSRLPFGNTVRPELAAGATHPIVPPADPAVLTSFRVGPTMLGRGYVEAVLDSEIERHAEEQRRRTDAIGGEVNYVVYASESNPDSTLHSPAKCDVLVGRFGTKARIATLDDFAADAMQGDMGLTTPLRPSELPNPDALSDDAKPGIDVGADRVRLLADYLRFVEIPSRRGLTDQGRALFEKADCSVCHVPTMRTKSDYPVAQLRAIDAPIYSDLLLHDMGFGLADGISDERANWR
ncbi:MAG: di-heme oxidoredictase family protein, partial [Polyangiaceae bacterium]